MSLVCFAMLLATAAAEEPGNMLTVMTYNLRYASPAGKDSWPVRRPLVAKVIQAQAPDVIGTQEGLYRQLLDIEEDIGYRWIGVGREGGSRGEFMAVFYNSEHLEPLEFDHYWLSDTPAVIGSKGWGNHVIRMVTWVRFSQRSTGRSFYFINTHFDHQSQPAREKSAALVLERSRAMPADAPVILVGDFNAAAERNAAYSTLVGEGRFFDSWNVAQRIGDQVRTFNGFRFPAPKDGDRIDWILYRGPIRPETTSIIADDFDGQYPSDHFPVVTRFVWAD